MPPTAAWRPKLSYSFYAWLGGAPSSAANRL